MPRSGPRPGEAPGHSPIRRTALARCGGLTLLAALALALTPPPDAQIQLTGSVEATGDGSAFWVQRTDPISGLQGFILVLILPDQGDFKAMEFSFVGGERPAPGTHDLFSFFDVPDTDDMEDWLPEGVMASYLSGRWSSWRELSDMVETLSGPDVDFEEWMSWTSGMGTGVSGTVEVSGWSGDRMSGRVSAGMVLMADSGGEAPFQISATFQAGPEPME